MRIIRVGCRDKTFYARLENGMLHCLDKNAGITAPVPLEHVRILPLAAPTKIICLAVNYLAHGREIKHEIPEVPRLFFKPPSALIMNEEPIVLPTASLHVDYEGELAVILGRFCRDVEPGEASKYVFGYTCANDVTARDLQKQDVLFARAKGFDTFAPIGPWIETNVGDLENLSVKTFVNNELRQEGNTKDMIFSTFKIISFISKVMTLVPGDIIFTGTPEGVGPLSPGDEVTVEIENVGRLTNPVLYQGHLAG